ncbi:MAG: type I-F CRISPR-associated endoribonuclease Cas6/Csy4 [Gallionellaceae bacterium]
MKAKSYIDFEALEGGEDMPSYAVLAKAYHVLHGAFGGCDGKYAVAFPCSKSGLRQRTVGSVIRVFAETSADLYSLLEKVRGHHLMRDYMRVNMPQDVPENFAGEWMSWQRVRVQKKEGLNRAATIERAEKSPYFDLRSSKGSVFQMRIYAKKAKPQIEGFTPNSYGLATGGNRQGVGLNLFSLPVL